MSFLYPLGLLGLIGVPILIIIYIIKNKHTEQIVSSNYLWHLSEKFLKNKKPISMLSGIISLILQLLAVIVISLLLAHPVITLPNTAKEYCFILDGSGSMNTVYNGKTRLELGKDKITNIINDSTDGSKYTLVFASDTTRVIYEKLGNKEKACEMLESLTCSGVTANYNVGLQYVQEYFNDNSSLITYLITDENYQTSNIELINVANNEENCGILDVNYEYVNRKLQISGTIVSYTSDKNVILQIYIDESLIKEENISLKKLEDFDFKYESSKTEFVSLRVEIVSEDSLSLDDSKIIYNIEKEHQFTTLLVSDRPFYLESIISTIGTTTVEVVSREEYTSLMRGYSLYIFDSFSPNELPNDGTIWLFGATDNIVNSGFSVQDIVEDENGVMLTYPKNSTSLYKTLTSNLEKEPIYVSKYVKYGLYRNFTILLTHNGNPVVFTGTTETGSREVVFGFDLHDSNLPLLMDYIFLSQNLLSYSFPVLLDKGSFVCGDNVNINILSNCKSIRVETPNGNSSYLDVSNEIAELKVTEVGTYKLIVTIGDEQKEFSFFVDLPQEESSVKENLQELNLQGTQYNDYFDGIYDKLIILFIILTIIFIVDWMVYCYEQYQLR